MAHYPLLIETATPEVPVYYRGKTKDSRVLDKGDGTFVVQYETSRGVWTDHVKPDGGVLYRFFERAKETALWRADDVCSHTTSTGVMSMRRCTRASVSDGVCTRHHPKYISPKDRAASEKYDRERR